MADLNEITVDLYNRFNVHDHPDDLIHALRLPLLGGAPLEICFAGDKERWHNALAILSEGHLRCLGLAILLAKNIKLSLPVILLDDAVNAIDHDHREGIRTTLFGHPDLKGKQLIVTCHSGEFIKNIHNYHAKGAMLYTLMPHQGDHHPLIHGGDTRNFLQLADRFLKVGNLRDGLAQCRRAVEGLTLQTWRKLVKDSPDTAVLSLPTRRPGLPVESRAIADQLLSVLNKAIRAGVLTEVWTLRRDQLQLLLQHKDYSLAWPSLNGGSHEDDDRDDFEAGTVKKLRDCLGTWDTSFDG